MYNLIDKNDKFIELQDGDKTLLIPTDKAIIVDDESDITTIKSVATRKTIASYSIPKEPTIDGKYKAIYTGGNIITAECNGPNESIMQNNITLTDLESIEIGSCVRTLGNYAFYNCNSLTSVTIGYGLTGIGNNVFRNDANLTSITIPSSVTEITSYFAFYGTPWWNNYSADTKNHYGNIVYINNIALVTTSTTITSCTFKEDTTYIGSSALNGCNNLTSITVLATTPPRLPNTTVFRGINCPIYVPAESVEAYKTATNWDFVYGNIQPIA